MDTLIRDWAGRERAFRLDFGGVLDLEEACGKIGIGAIFLRLSSGQFFARDIRETIRLALIGGGMTQIEATQLVRAQFDAKPYMAHAATASEILIALMTGVEDAGQRAEPGDPAQPYRFSQISQICTVFHLSPNDLRAMGYADFVNMARGYAAGRPGAQTSWMSEEEFLDLLAKYEPGES